MHNAFVVFVVPVPESLGFTRGSFAFYTTVQAIMITLVTPFYGFFFKRFGLRNVMLVAAIICCAVQFGFSVSSHLWHFYALAVVHGLFIVGVEIMAVGTLINNWFVAKKGIATGIAYTGSGIVAGIMVPLLTKVIELFGWPMGYRTIAACSLMLLLPVIIFIVRDRPQDMGLLPLGVEQNGCNTPQEGSLALHAGVMRAEALKSPVFWLFALATLSISVSTMGMALHSAAFLADIGYTTGYASIIVSIFMFVTVAAKLLFGAVFDRWGLGVGAFLTGAVCLISSVSLLLSSLRGLPTIFAVSFGFAFATQTVSLTLLTSNLFGNRDFINIYSLIMMLLMFGSAIGSPLPAFIYDAAGSYVPAWILSIVLSAIATVSLMAAVALCKRARGDQPEIDRISN